MNTNYIVHKSIEEDPYKYGLPELKKYPMPDAKHVRSAIKFFNYVDPKHEEELARAIIRRMKEYGLTFDDFEVGEENRFSKYVPEKALAHHGILGMKWGVRRYQNADGTFTAAGKARYSEEKSLKTDNSNDHHAKDGSGKAVAVAVATSLINPTNAALNAVKAGQAAAGAIKSKKYEKERENLEIDERTGFKLKDPNKEYSMEDDAKRVNPSVNNYNTNTKSNCMLCTTTYDLRRRGYDVTAKTASVGYQPEDIKKWYPKANITTYKEPITPKQQKYIDKMAAKGKENIARQIVQYSGRRSKETIEKVQNDLLAQGDGARGNLMVRFTLGGGHSVAYENSGGKTRIIDSQTNDTGWKLSSFLKQTSGELYVARLDNIDFDSEAIKEAARS